MFHGMPCIFGAGLLFIMASGATPVRAATCNAGQYLDADGVTCRACKEGKASTYPVYCPGDDIQHNCPTSDTDYEKLSGHTIVRGAGGGEAIWSGANATADTSCYGDITFDTVEGHRFLAECPWNGGNYYYPCNTNDLYHGWIYNRAGPGYYLAGYRWTSGTTNLYYGVTACTNAPQHAHYTASGTPDAPDGSVKDANDCPWECDCGYVRSGDVCIEADRCDAGFRTLRAFGGISVRLYSRKMSTPGLAVSDNGKTCWACLESGVGAGAINVQYNSATYHTVNE